MTDVRDFYVLNTADPAFNDSMILEDSVLDVIVSKIKMVLFTNPGEIISDVQCGIGLEYLLWSTTVSTDFIKSEIQKQFSRYIEELSNYSYSINLSMMEGIFGDILIINIQINDVQITAVFR